MDIHGSILFNNDEEVIKKAIRILEINPTDLFYELGSGFGDVSFYVAKKFPSVKVYGTERSFFPCYFAKVKK